MKIAKINTIIQTTFLAILLGLLVAMIFEQGFMMWVLYLYLLLNQTSFGGSYR